MSNDKNKIDNFFNKLQMEQITLDYIKKYSDLKNLMDEDLINIDELESEIIENIKIVISKIYSI